MFFFFLHFCPAETWLRCVEGVICKGFQFTCKDDRRLKEPGCHMGHILAPLPKKPTKNHKVTSLEDLFFLFKRLGVYNFGLGSFVTSH